jgi:16S rRNA (guanine527-N7)-methyltransferase
MVPGADPARGGGDSLPGGSDPAAGRPDPAHGLARLASRFGLTAEAEAKLHLLLRLLTDEPRAPTAIRDERAVLDDHLADSLVALDFAPVRAAREALDLGSGAGLPGLPLAIALPETTFTLLESSSRKCQFLRHAIEVCGIANAAAVHDRAESFAAGRERYDLVTVRAVASAVVNAEYAAPLLRVGGTLLMWRGRRDPEAESGLARAAVQLGLGELSIEPVEPYPGARNRHLYLLRKQTDTPPRFPRRPGIALKRPLGAEKRA